MHISLIYVAGTKQTFYDMNDSWPIDTTRGFILFLKEYTW